MIRAAVLCLMLAGCAALPSLLGKGPNVAANGQIGATNAQTIGTTDASSQTVSRSTVGTLHQSRDVQTVTAGQVEQVVVNQAPSLKRDGMWLIAVVVALFLHSPLKWVEDLMASKPRRSPGK